jgi:hypothetical protein
MAWDKNHPLRTFAPAPLNILALNTKRLRSSDIPRCDAVRGAVES